MSTNYYSGRVHTVVFENEAQAFYILRMTLDRPDTTETMFGGLNLSAPISVRGNIPGLSVQTGAWFGFEARQETHETYGKQLVITRAPIIKGVWTSEMAAQMLTSHGVGELITKRLLSHYGDKLVSILDAGDPEGLRDVPGMTPFSAQHTIGRWQTVKAFFQTLQFLNEAGVPKGKITQIWTTFGDDAQRVLSSDPWSLLRLEGITFQQADEVAQKLGISLDHPERVRGAVLHACRTRKGLGHLYVGSGEVMYEVQGLATDASAPQVAKAIAELHKEKLLVVDRTTKPGFTAIYEPWLHRLEGDCATILASRMQTAQFGPESEADYIKALASFGPETRTLVKDGKGLMEVAASALQEWGINSKVVLSEKQMAGALNALTQPVSILTGLPGTGKTTSLRAVVRVLQDADVPFLLVAPTGIAAKRITSVTGAKASTIHRAFGAKGWDKGGERESTYVGIVGDSGEQERSDGSSEQWGHSSNNPHPAQVIIVDESSMVDQHLLYRILSCTRPTARLVLVGDAAQLPSVGPGNVLRDMLATGFFPTAALTEIFRQADLSDIVVAAHAVHNGDIPRVTNDTDGDFVLVPASDEDDAQNKIVSLVDDLYNNQHGTSFQVLSPRHAGTLGVTLLNARIRELLNPRRSDIHEMKLGNEIVREGDRIMVVKNNYDLGIFNGDTGKINRLDRKARVVEIKVHGPPVQYVQIPFKDAPTYLRLAYGVTVHKMQGQEVDVIIMPLVPGFGHQLQRNLLYTAITRARKRVYLVGKHEALVKAVENNKIEGRNTLFTERLLAAFAQMTAGGSVSTALG